MDGKIFTLAEAQSLVPQLRAILEEVSAEWSQIKEMEPVIDKVRDKAPYDGFSEIGVRYVTAVSHLMVLVSQIKEMGVLLKDVDKGLCDFPYMRQGRVVYLCWQLDEASIEYWHDIEAGFAGRERLDDTDK